MKTLQIIPWLKLSKMRHFSQSLVGASDNFILKLANLVVRLGAADRRQPLENMLPDVESKELYIMANLDGYCTNYIYPQISGIGTVWSE